MSKTFKAFYAAAVISLILVLIASMTFPPIKVNAQGIGYVKSGQQAVTATAAVVTGITYGNVCIKALNGNTINVYLGGAGVTDSTGMELAPGNAYCAPEVNSNEFYVIASTTGASISWIVSR
jgi:lysylphosphatidylglycerol synthetase-like protein (DUF2156 family)